MLINSIKVRLGIGLLVSLIITLGFLWYFASQSIRTLSENYVIDRLELGIKSLLTELSLDDQDQPRVNSEKIDAVFQHAFSGHYFKITLHNNKEKNTLKSSSLQEKDIKIPTMSPGETVHFQTAGPLHKPLLVLVKAFNIREHVLSITIAEDMTPFRKGFRDFQWDYSIISFISLLVLVFIQGVILNRMFNKLEQARREIGELEKGTIAKLNTDVCIELKPFVKGINRMLMANEHRLERSRNALENMAHVLKTPLTVLTRLAHHKDVQSNPDIKSILTEKTSELLCIIERQLKRVRLSDPIKPGSFFCLEKEIPPLIRTLKSIYFDKKLQIDGRFPSDVMCQGDREDMVELIGSIADNACKWAEHHVMITAGNEGGLWVTIEDDGPGCSEEDIAQLAQRGVRLDESKTGNGLGLAIAQDIVEQYGGTMTFGRSPDLNGFLVQIQIPNHFA